MAAIEVVREPTGLAALGDRPSNAPAARPLVAPADAPMAATGAGPSPWLAMEARLEALLVRMEDRITQRLARIEAVLGISVD